MPVRFGAQGFSSNLMGIIYQLNMQEKGGVKGVSFPEQSTAFGVWVDPDKLLSTPIPIPTPTPMKMGRNCEPPWWNAMIPTWSRISFTAAGAGSIILSGPWPTPGAPADPPG